MKLLKYFVFSWITCVSIYSGCAWEKVSLHWMLIVFNSIVAKFTLVFRFLSHSCPIRGPFFARFLFLILNVPPGFGPVPPGCFVVVSLLRGFSQVPRYQHMVSGHHLVLAVLSFTSRILLYLPLHIFLPSFLSNFQPAGDQSNSSSSLKPVPHRFIIFWTALSATLSTVSFWIQPRWRSVWVKTPLGSRLSPFPPVLAGLSLGLYIGLAASSVPLPHCTLDRLPCQILWHVTWIIHLKQIVCIDIPGHSPAERPIFWTSFPADSCTSPLPCCKTLSPLL